MCILAQFSKNVIKIQDSELGKPGHKITTQQPWAKEEYSAQLDLKKDLLID